MTTNSGQQTTQQSQTTEPWKPAIPALTSILSNIQGLQGQSGINTTENAAIQQLISNAGGIPNLAPQVGTQATNFLGGDPFNVINPAYQGYGNLIRSAGITDPRNLNPLNTPGLSNALNTVNQDITDQINGEFAAAGRSGSGYDTQTLARGLAQGEAGLLLPQYNQNVNNLINAGSNLFNAGIGTNTALQGNVGAGADLGANLAPYATQGPGALLSAGQAPFNLLSANQGILSGLAVPIAGLGGHSEGTSNTQSSYTPSVFSDIMGGFKTLFPYGFQAGGRQ